MSSRAPWEASNGGEFGALVRHAGHGMMWSEYLHCCFSGRVDAGGEVTLNGRPIPKVDKFKYLGSIIQRNGDIDEDINQRIKVG